MDFHIENLVETYEPELDREGIIGNQVCLNQGGVEGSLSCVVYISYFFVSVSRIHRL